MRILHKEKIAPISLCRDDTLNVEYTGEIDGKPYYRKTLASFRITEDYLTLDTIIVVEDVEGLGLATSLGVVIGREAT